MKKMRRFEVGVYPRHNETRCRCRVYENGRLVARFEPDAHNIIQVCQHTGTLKGELLYSLTDEQF